MALYKRGATWYVRFRDEHGELQRKSLRTGDKRVAAMLEADELRSVDMRRVGVMAPSPVAQRDTMLVDLIDAYIDERFVRRGSVAPYYRQLKRDLISLANYNAWRTPRDIDAAGVRRWFEDIKGGLVRKTKCDLQARLRNFFAWLADGGPGVDAAGPRAPLIVYEYGRNPADGLVPELTRRAGRMAIHAGRPSARMALTHDEIYRLIFAPVPDDAPRKLRGARFPQRRDVYCVLVHTGLRRDTARELTARHWRPRADGTGELVIAGHLMKSGREFRMPVVAPRVVAAIERLIARERARSGTSNPNHRDGHWLGPIPKPHVLRFDAAGMGVRTRDADGNVLDVHALRVTFGTQLAQQLGEGGLLHVQYLMDHADLETTRRIYIKAGASPMRPAVGRMPDFSSPLERDDSRAFGVVGRVGPA